jgi:hypothetical protein
MGDLDALRRQLSVNFRRAEYPVESPRDLGPALPNGPETRFEVGEQSVTAMDLFARADCCDFPYEDVEALVADLLDAVDTQPPA